MNIVKLIFVAIVTAVSILLVLISCGESRPGSAGALVLSPLWGDAGGDELFASFTEPDNPFLAAAYPPRKDRTATDKLIALTFDDGPNTKTTPLVLDLLKQYDAHATFFCIGKNITDKTRHLVQRAVSEGNEIASHTWSHPFLSRISHSRRTEEMKKTAEAIHDAAGYYPRLYRPPYLDCNTKVLADISLPAISGSASDDWIKTMTPDMIAEKVLSSARPGAIFVLHDFVGNLRTPMALETLIPALQKQGYTLVTVSQLFAHYGVNPEPHTLYTCGMHASKRVSSDKTKKHDRTERHDKSKKTDKHDRNDRSKKSKKADKSSKPKKYNTPSTSPVKEQVPEPVTPLPVESSDI